MSFLDQNANFGLLVLVAVIALALVGVTLFFQEKFNQVNEEYDAKVKSLEDATSSLSKTQGTLEELNEDLGVKEQREETLSKNYVTVTEENEALNVENNQLNDEINKCNSDLDDKESEINTLNKQIQDLNNNLENCEANKEEWKNKFLSC